MAYTEFEKDILKEAYSEARGNSEISKRCQVVTFTSYSKGEGRKRDEPLQVELLVVDDKYAFVIKNDNLKPRSKKDKHIGPDRIADEILEHLPLEDRTPERLLEEVKRLK